MTASDTAQNEMIEPRIENQDTVEEMIYDELEIIGDDIFLYLNVIVFKVSSYSMCLNFLGGAGVPCPPSPCVF